MRLSVLFLGVLASWGLASCARPAGGSDGADGRSCTVVAGEVGLATVRCTDGTTAAAPDLDGRDGADGAQGPRGAAGRAGLAWLVSLLPIPETLDAQATCPGGGALYAAGPDRNADGVLQPAEVEPGPIPLCVEPPPCFDPESGTATLAGDAYLFSELDMRRFQLVGCNAVAGDLHVGGDSFTSLHGDMSALSRLVEVQGSVELAFINGSFAGLGKLATVGETLWIHDALVRALAGLEGLREVKGDLVLGCGLPLDDLSAIYGLRHVGGKLRVADGTWAALLQGHSDVQIDGGVAAEVCDR